ncbi:hypothetical protein MRB53_000084 [Persea americana]|uniref:Uncharacterized protein n=1 Tax=Persea americana TaxID=3435 RepID=A0ACC2MNU7_PERAE|nr:hypothetical protein MRB53_000084 [Persea americana]
MVDFLIQKCGLSIERADRASKTLTRIKSPEKPESVLKFVKQSGFNDTHIRNAISKQPKLLAASIENHLQPIISYLIVFLNTDDSIVRAIKKWTKILTYDLHKQIIPSIEVLQKCGIPDQQISSLLRTNPFFVTQGTQWVESLVTRVERFGIGRGSGMFVYAVLAMGRMGETTMDAKVELLKSFGWSEQDILVAFQK